MTIEEAIDSVARVRDHMVDGRAFLIMEECIKELADLEHLMETEAIDRGDY